MAYGFRQRINIGHGNSVNIGKNSISFSTGVKGCRLTIGEKGSYLTTSIPGTGIYSRQKIGGGYGGSSFYSNNKTDDSNRYSKSSNFKRRCILWFTSIFCLIAFVAMIVSFIRTNYMNNRETLYCFLKIVIPAVAIEIGAFILFLILKWCANKFISIPREYAKLKNKFDEEEESICTDINIAIENAKAKLPSCSDELQRVCINALTDNYRGIELNNFYQEKLSELNQQDISDSIPLQNLVQYIEDKTLNIGQQYQVVVYDIEDLISGKLASAYTEFLDKYETLLTSKQIVQGNHCINFNRWCFYNVYYKGRAIPSFNIESTISGVVFVLPTCFLLYTYNGNIEFIPFLSSYIAPSIDFAISKFKTLYSLDFPDSKVVGETWEHINKDGSPDKRYSENSHYFMVEIANIYLNIKGKTTYGFSNVNFARDFASAFRYLRDTLIESNITALKDVKLAPKEVKPGNEDKDAKPDTSLRVTKTSKHQVGDKHPSKPWVWTEYAPGKFDWRKDKLN